MLHFYSFSADTICLRTKVSAVDKESKTRWDHNRMYEKHFGANYFTYLLTWDLFVLFRHEHGAPSSALDREDYARSVFKIKWKMAHVKLDGLRVDGNVFAIQISWWSPHTCIFERVLGFIGEKKTADQAVTGGNLRRFMSDWHGTLLLAILTCYGKHNNFYPSSFVAREYLQIKYTGDISLRKSGFILHFTVSCIFNMNPCTYLHLRQYFRCLLIFFEDSKVDLLAGIFYENVVSQSF